MRGRTLRMSLAVLEAAMAAALAVIMVGCAGSGSTPSTSGGSGSAEPIKIGAIVSLTGTYAGLGAPEEAALELEVKRINDAGGINGRPIELIIEDDGTDEAKAVAAASKLIDQEQVVAIIGGTGTGQTMAIRGDVNKAAIPQVSMAGGSVITSDFDPLVFQTPWSNNLVIPFELAYMKKAGITRLAVISDTGGFGKDGLAVLEAQTPKAGVQLVSNQTFNVGDTDFAAQLTKVKSSDADALLIISSGKETAALVSQSKQLGLDTPLYGTHGNARMEFVEGAGDAAEGFILPAGKILLPESHGTDTEAFKVATGFIEAFTAASGGDQPSTFAGHAYDAINLIAVAAERLGSDVTPAGLRDEIEKTSGFVGIGGTFTFSPTDHNGLTEADLNMYQVKSGAWTIAP